MNLKKLLIMILSVTLMLSPVALMQEDNTQPTPDTAQMVSEDVLVDGVEAGSANSTDESVSSEMVDDIVDETGDVDLMDEPEEIDLPDYSVFEAQYSSAELDLDESDADSTLLLAADGSVEINDDNFPDHNFQEFIRQNYDKDDGHGNMAGDGYLSSEEIEAVTYMRLLQPDGTQWGTKGYGIKDLKGIKLFTNLQHLICSKNELTELDLSGCTSLIVVNCDENQLTRVDVSQCVNLEDFSCYKNSLTTLDLTGLGKLRNVHCKNNKLTSLKLDGCANLTELACTYNNLTILDLTHCPKIASIVKNEYYNAYYQEDDYLFETYDAENNYVRYELLCDPGIQIITENTSQDASGNGDAAGNPAAQTADQGTSSTQTPSTQTSSTQSSSPVISAVNKSSKATVTAAPGTVCQLDLGGATGKGFKSSKKKVAIVDAAGAVTIRGAGKTKITFKVGKKKRNVTLTVIDPTIPTSITLTTVITAVKKGDTVTLTPIIPDGSNAGGFKWKSSNKKVARVSSTGVVTFKKPGKVTITCIAKRGNKKGRIKFTVGK